MDQGISGIDWMADSGPVSPFLPAADLRVTLAAPAVPVAVPAAAVAFMEPQVYRLVHAEDPGGHFGASTALSVAAITRLLVVFMMPRH